MTEKVYTVLFVCTGNSGTSILAERLLDYWGKKRFKVWSAGSHPVGTVNPFALEVLKSKKLSIEGLRSKSWEEFTQPSMPPLDFVITVCEKVKDDIRPAWPGQPITAHWGVEDPVIFEGTDKEKLRKFRTIASFIENRIKIFSSLRLEKLDKISINNEIDAIGNMKD